MAARFTIEGRPHPRDLLKQRLLQLENATGSRNVWSWTSGSTQSGSSRGNSGVARASGPSRNRSQEYAVRDVSQGLRHEQSPIDVARRDRKGVTKNQVFGSRPCSSTSSVLQVASSKCTDQHTQQCDKRSATWLAILATTTTSKLATRRRTSCSCSCSCHQSLPAEGTNETLEVLFKTLP
jgi:hypothetical protein